MPGLTQGYRVVTATDPLLLMWCAELTDVETIKYQHFILLEEVGKGPVTLRNFLSNVSRNAVAKQVAEELHSK